jgi:hypothetical protein
MQVISGAPGSGGQQSLVLVQRSLIFAHSGVSAVQVPIGSVANSLSLSFT